MKKKNFRMIAGIILHPVRILVARYYRNTYQEIIQRNIAERDYWKEYYRMHDMSEVTRTAYTTSEIYARRMKYNFSY